MSLLGCNPVKEHLYFYSEKKIENIEISTLRTLAKHFKGLKKQNKTLPSRKQRQNPAWLKVRDLSLCSYTKFSEISMFSGTVADSFHGNTQRMIIIVIGKISTIGFTSCNPH